MHMDTGFFHKPEHVLVKLKGLVRVQSTLQQNLGAAKFLGLTNLVQQFFPGQHRALRIFRGLKKSTELAGRYTYIGIVDITVDNVSNYRLRMQSIADGIGHNSQLVEVRLFFKAKKLLARDSIAGNDSIYYFLHSAKMSPGPYTGYRVPPARVPPLVST